MDANAVYSIAEDYGVDYIDFVSMDQVADYATDCFDAHEHLHPSGARKVSDYLGRYISEHYDIADHRGEEKYAAWETDAQTYREKKLADLGMQTDIECVLMLLHDDDFSVEVDIGAGSALFESEKQMTLMQNIAREHVFEEDLFAKWSNSLVPLERLEEAAENGQSYRLVVNRGTGVIVEEVGKASETGVKVTVLDRDDGMVLLEKKFDENLCLTK